MIDLIDRQEAIEYLTTNMTWYSEDGYEAEEEEKAQAIRELINGVPSAQRWIPCSERLPEEGQMVLTTIKGTDLIRVMDGETLEEAVERARRFVRVSVGFLEEDGWYGADGFPEVVQPIAWMPLPDPANIEEETWEQ